MNYHTRPNCRLCSGEDLTVVLSLPATPLANEFPKLPGKPQDEFPLWLARCGDCGHVQLPVVVDPERLFRDYVYVSGTSPVFVEHFRQYAEDVSMGLEPSDLVVEIGSNDGTLLRFFRDKEMRVLGIDPATEIAAKATDDGVPTWSMFFDKTAAQTIESRMGKARLILANNVFAHADDLKGIVEGVRGLLAKDGLFVFEVSYLVDVVQNTLFDTIYHEHLSYHSLRPLLGFFDRLGMSVVDAKRVNTHGGSIRVIVAPVPNVRLSLRGKDLLGEENALFESWNWQMLQADIMDKRSKLGHIVRTARLKGQKVAAYGAPAKATTLLRTFDLGDAIDFVVDDSPHKQGRWMPGGIIPVLPSSAIAERRPDLVLILAWNFAESILAKLHGYMAAGGTCLVPLPEISVHSHAGRASVG